MGCCVRYNKKESYRKGWYVTKLEKELAEKDAIIEDILNDMANLREKYEQKIKKEYIVIMKNLEET